MKKLLFVFVAIAAMTMASCGGQTTPTSITNDTAVVDTIDTVLVDSVDTVLVNTAAVDSIVAE